LRSFGEREREREKVSGVPGESYCLWETLGWGPTFSLTDTLIPFRNNLTYSLSTYISTSTHIGDYIIHVWANCKGGAIASKTAELILFSTRMKLLLQGFLLLFFNNYLSTLLSYSTFHILPIPLFLPTSFSTYIITILFCLLLLLQNVPLTQLFFYFFYIRHFRISIEACPVAIATGFATGFATDANCWFEKEMKCKQMHIL
jgi:hypothetical protein